VNDEQELVDRLSRGALGAFQKLVEQNKRKIYYLAFDIVGNHADAEDISQEVFIKIYRFFKTFKRDAKLGSWLYRITVNASIDHLRRKSAMPETAQTGFFGRDDPVLTCSSQDFGSNPERRAEGQLMQERVDRALRKISAQERSVFVLRHYHDLPLKDIAEAMNVSIGSVKSYLFRGLKKIQKELAVGGANTPTEVGHG
jgi:RNA polymerase sigma-70 factor (ECF subfamily)